jgi:hypothetical protein
VLEDVEVEVLGVARRYRTDGWRTRFGPAIHSPLPTPAYVAQPATYGAPITTTSAPRRSAGDVASGCPRNVGMSSSISGKWRVRVSVELRMSLQSG